MREAIHQGTNHLVIQEALRDKGSFRDLVYFSDTDGNRKSNYYDFIEPFPWGDFDTLYLAKPHLFRRQEIEATKRSVASHILGIDVELIGPMQLVWAPDHYRTFAREIPIKIYSPELDNYTGYIVHNFQGAVKQLVNPIDGTVTEGAHKFRKVDGKIYAAFGADIFTVKFGSPDEMARQTDKRSRLSRYSKDSLELIDPLVLDSFLN
jgi:hypothetical protein